MIFNHKTRAYHDDSDCELLNSDYLNYHIPQEMLDSKNEALIEKYRAWFLKNHYLIESGEETKFEAMKERCRLNFGLTTLPEIVRLKKSGVSLLHEKSLVDIERDINQIISESDVFVHASAKNRRIPNRFKKLAYLGERHEAIKDNNTEFSDDEVREVLRKFQQDFKKPVMALLKEWYRIQHNRTLRIDVMLPEALGLKKCSKCAVAKPIIIGQACYIMNDRIAA